MKRTLLAAFFCLSFTACGGGGDTGPSSAVGMYTGIWEGAYALKSCSQTEDVAQFDLCGTSPQVLPDRFELQQTKSTVTGSFYLGTILFAFPATDVALDGSLTLAGTFAGSGVNILATWTLRLNASRSSLIGDVTQLWTVDGVSGRIDIVGTTPEGSTARVASARSQPPVVVPLGIDRPFERLRLKVE